MLLGFEVTLFVCLFSLGLYWVLMPVSPKASLLSLIAVNSGVLFLANSVLAFYLFAQFVLVFLLYQIYYKIPKSLQGGLPWLAFMGLVPVNLHVWLGDGFSISSIFGFWAEIKVGKIIWTAGSTFFVIKSFVALKEAIRDKCFNAIPILAGLTFIPSFPAGPIFGSKPFMPENILRKIDRALFVRSFLQFGWGAASLYLIAPKLGRLADKMPDYGWTVIGRVYIKFAALFFDFSGYSIIAISLAALFGVSLPENFNRPYLATSIKEFWQRWHMSLNWFIGTYLFKPFVRHTGSQQVGIFLAFVCAGLWHEFTLGYLLWGIGHGLALSIAINPPVLWKSLMGSIHPVGRKLVGWFLTMSWVAVLSYLANVVLKKG